MGLSGSFAELPLADLIEMTALGAKTGRLVLSDETGAVAGELAFRAGLLVGGHVWRAERREGVLRPVGAHRRRVRLRPGGRARRGHLQPAHRVAAHRRHAASGRDPALAPPAPCCLLYT